VVNRTRTERQSKEKLIIEKQKRERIVTLVYYKKIEDKVAVCKIEFRIKESVTCGEDINTSRRPSS